VHGLANVKRRPGRPAQPLDRSTLIAVASRAFAAHGYSAASLSEIASAVGLRKASLYHHFPTKDALYFAVLDAAVADLRRLVLDARLEAGDFGQRLDRLGELVTDYFATHPDAARLLTREMVGGGRYLQGPGRREVEMTLLATSAFLEAGMEAGAFRRQDPRQLALSIVGLHFYYFAAAALSGTLVERDVLEPVAVLARKAAVRDQVRALCLAPATGTAAGPAGGRPRSPRRGRS
jgi:TetR/AcrR family transcriptional regulator